MDKQRCPVVAEEEGRPVGLARPKRRSTFSGRCAGECGNNGVSRCVEKGEKRLLRSVKVRALLLSDGLCSCVDDVVGVASLLQGQKRVVD